MTTFLDFHAFAAARGEGLHPELRLLFERAGTCSGVSSVPKRMQQTQIAQAERISSRPTPTRSRLKFVAQADAADGQHHFSPAVSRGLSGGRFRPRRANLLDLALRGDALHLV